MNLDEQIALDDIAKSAKIMARGPDDYGQFLHASNTVLFLSAFGPLATREAAKTAHDETKHNRPVALKYARANA